MTERDEIDRGDTLPGTVVTVGTFDGVHRGHWTVLGEIRARARSAGLRSVLVTFDPHPLTIVRPEAAPPLLTTPDEKREILAESGLDAAVFLRFSRALSQYSPRRFVEEILVARLGVRQLVIGYDHGFGRGRAGGAETLRTLGAEFGFSIDVVDPVSMGDRAVSSTAIRAAVAEGDLGAANDALGRAYPLVAHVERGDGRGRGLGFPTANLGSIPAEKLVPPPGIYAVWANLPGGVFPGALHVGPRPTFEGASASIELHVLDFAGDLYGARLRVDFVARIRGVRSFPSVDALVAQMRSDVDEVRRLLQPE
jgi:riboflavin kinase/FMN adenylyltransferase